MLRRIVPVKHQLYSLNCNVRVLSGKFYEFVQYVKYKLLLNLTLLSLNNNSDLYLCHGFMLVYLGIGF
jgi:hypothetical protein